MWSSTLLFLKYLVACTWQQFFVYLCISLKKVACKFTYIPHFVAIAAFRASPDPSFPFSLPPACGIWKPYPCVHVTPWQSAVLLNCSSARQPAGQLEPIKLYLKQSVFYSESWWFTCGWKPKPFWWAQKTWFICFNTVIRVVQVLFILTF